MADAGIFAHIAGNSCGTVYRTVATAARSGLSDKMKRHRLAAAHVPSQKYRLSAEAAADMA